MLLPVIWILHRHMFGDFKTLFLVSIFWNQDQKIQHLWRFEFQPICHIYRLPFQYLMGNINKKYLSFNNQVGKFFPFWYSYELGIPFVMYEMATAFRKRSSANDYFLCKLKGSCKTTSIMQPLLEMIYAIYWMVVFIWW